MITTDPEFIFGTDLRFMSQSRNLWDFMSDKTDILNSQTLYPSPLLRDPGIMFSRGINPDTRFF